MDVDGQIAAAIERGAKEGMDALGPLEKVIFAISEAEVFCDMEGIDGLITSYGIASMKDYSSAFRQLGAIEIAETLAKISDLTLPVPEDLLSRANTLITERRGYQYESIRKLFI